MYNPEYECTPLENMFTTPKLNMTAAKPMSASQTDARSE